jgi:hypothetical protein
MNIYADILKNKKSRRRPRVLACPTTIDHDNFYTVCLEVAVGFERQRNELVAPLSSVVILPSCAILNTQNAGNLEEARVDIYMMRFYAAEE